jgi:hypothetical protein
MSGGVNSYNITLEEGVISMSSILIGEDFHRRSLIKYNELPSELKDIHFLKIFKTRIRVFIGGLGVICVF